MTDINAIISPLGGKLVIPRKRPKPLWSYRLPRLPIKPYRPPGFFYAKNSNVTCIGVPENVAQDYAPNYRHDSSNSVNVGEGNPCSYINYTIRKKTCLLPIRTQVTPT